MLETYVFLFNLLKLLLLRNWAPLWTPSYDKAFEDLGGLRNHVLDAGPCDGPIVRQKGMPDSAGGSTSMLWIVECGMVLLWSGHSLLCLLCHIPPTPVNSYTNYSFFHYLLNVTESNNLLTDWQYFGVLGYTTHWLSVCTEGGGVHMELFTKAIKGNENQLARRIQVIGLWRELLSRKVLTEEQLQSCQNEVFCSIIFVLWKLLVIVSISVAENPQTNLSEFCL